MRPATFQYANWIPPLLALILLPCAVELGRLCHWTPGAASLLLLLIPVCIASLGRNWWGVLVTTLVAVLSSLREGLISSGGQVVPIEAHSFPLVTSGLFLVLGPLLRQIVSVQQEAVPLETAPPGNTASDRFNDHTPSIAVPCVQPDVPFQYQAAPNSSAPAEDTGSAFPQTSRSTSPKSSPGLSLADPRHQVAPDDVVTAVLPDVPQPQVFEHAPDSEDPQLLLTLQEVGWRVATDFDLASLYQTVRHTTQRILRCKRCTVLLWDANAAALIDAMDSKQGTSEPSASRHSASPSNGTDVPRMLSWVVANRKLLVRADLELEIQGQVVTRHADDIVEAVAPLAVGSDLLGVLVLEGVETSTAKFRRMLQLLANVSALAIKNARQFQRVAEIARRDGLTGLLNHASFQERLRELVEIAQCQQTPLSVIMSDVDRFKSINDNYGHPVGDVVLREVARIWKTVIPEHAISARYGGEEFICAVPGMTLDQAADLAESLRHTLEILPVSFERGVLNVTASFGAAQLGRPARNATELVRLVDEALYQSKKGGRNRVTLVPVTNCPVVAVPQPNQSPVPIS